MVLIISRNSDLSTNEVIFQLNELNESWIRINENTEISISISIKNREFILKKNGISYNIEEFKSIWFRKGGIFLNFLSNINSLNYKIDSLSFNEFIFDELNSIENYLETEYFDKFVLGKPSLKKINKLNVLKTANLIGLDVPESVIIQTKEEIALFIKKCGRVITKPIFNNVRSMDPNYRYKMYTKEILLDDIIKLPNYFYPSLFQELIDKKFEIRTVYLKGIFYSMCIFSQINLNSSLDFRAGGFLSKLSSCNFKLPICIEDKLRALLLHYSIEFCSIDLIYGMDGKFYFLELNPFGQYAMVTKELNIAIENRIALILSNIIN